MYTAKMPNGKHSLMPTVIKPKFVSNENCPVPMCMSCEFAHAKKHSLWVVPQYDIKDREGILLFNNFQVCAFVPMDQFVVSTSGKFLRGYEEKRW